MPKFPYKPLGVNLDREFRNNYNQNLKDIESDIKELNGAQLDALDAAHEANVQANYAKEQGDYAGDKGDYAANNGDYAKQQGDYAKEQGDYAKNSTDVVINEANKAVQNAEEAVKNANQAINNSNVATENANQAANNANEKAQLADDKAKLAQEKITIMDSLESSLNNTLVQANEKIDETVVAINNTNQATKSANNAANSANQSAQLANEKANLAQEKVDSLSTLETTLNQEITESKQTTLEAKQVTETANNAATTATNNGDYAKEQGDYAKEQGDKVQDIIDGTGFIPTSEKGKPSGVATLDENGKVPLVQSQPVEWDNIENKPTNLETTNGAQTKATKALDDAKKWVRSFGVGGSSGVKTGINLNDMSDGGFYYVNTGTNLPPAAKTSGFLIVAALDYAAVLQIYVESNTPGRMFTRVSSRSTWTPWIGIKDDGNPLNTYRSVKDTFGVFQIVEQKNQDGNLVEKSVLTGGTRPNYTTRTVTYYDGTSFAKVIKTEVYTLSYDSDGDLISEVLQK